MGRALAKPITPSVRKANRLGAIPTSSSLAVGWQPRWSRAGRRKRWVSQGLNPSYEL